MNNERLRNRDLIAMHLRPGGGRHGGTRRARRRRDRRAAKRELTTSAGREKRHETEPAGRPERQHDAAGQGRGDPRAASDQSGRHASSRPTGRERR